MIVRGIHLPDGETHLVPHIEANPLVAGRGTYQHKKYVAAMGHAPRRGLAIDIGAHVGLWSRLLAIDFEQVEAFEPVPLHCELWSMNIDAENARLTETALGASERLIRIGVETGNSGNSRVMAHGHEVAQCRLDDLLPEAVADFIKIDCEGYESFVVAGAEALIRRSRPTMIVEQKRTHGKPYGVADTAAVEMLMDWGAEVRTIISGDYIVAWPDR